MKVKRDFISNERESGLHFIADLRATRRQIWQRALQHDGMESNTVFAVFSDDNPFVIFLDNITRQFFETVRQYKSLGYVGLSLNSRELYKPARRRSHKRKGLK